MKIYGCVGVPQSSSQVPVFSSNAARSVPQSVVCRAVFHSAAGLPAGQEM